MRQCKKCDEFKAESDFYKRKNGYPRHECKKCHSKYYKKLYIEDGGKANENRKKIWKKSRLKSYGLTLEEFDQMLADQSFSCAICGIPQEDFGRDLFVDHCHTEGSVRGLLCQECNSGLGFFKDSTENLMNAVRYLEGTSDED